jgi:glycosyltransferase involved in cell wall biosynthesis
MRRGGVVKGRAISAKLADTRDGPAGIGRPAISSATVEPRLGVYTDYTYSLVDGRPYAERAFALFIRALAPSFDGLLVIGRLDPDASRARYELTGTELVPLPHYPSLAHTSKALRGMFGSLGVYWHALGSVDAVWILGPHPLAFPFVAMARLRRRRVVLGVRQDSVAYMRSRRPDSRLRIAVARMMDAGFRLLARRYPTVVVGPAIARSYSSARRLLQISVSLVSERQLAAPGASGRDYEGDTLTAISVGRLDAEKNPLGLADALAELRKRDPRWRLVICGEGPLAGELKRRLAELGLSDAAELRGYVSHPDLERAYAEAHALLHVSWTEGLPQILFEAFAAGLPVVATDVGGIREAVGDAALLVAPGAAADAAASLERIGREPELRQLLVANGLELARSHTIESESARTAEFIAASARPRA